LSGGRDYEVLAVAPRLLDGDRMPGPPALCIATGLGEESRLSHQVRRNAGGRGWVSREAPNPSDARSTMVCLLPAGPRRQLRRRGTEARGRDVRRELQLTCSPPAELEHASAAPQRTSPATTWATDDGLPRRRRALIIFSSREHFAPIQNWNFVSSRKPVRCSIPEIKVGHVSLPHNVIRP